MVDDSGESALYINVSLNLTENTVGVHYKDQLVNAIEVESLLIMDPPPTHTHTHLPTYLPPSLPPSLPL
jgi:hypothetical protein